MFAQLAYHHRLGWRGHAVIVSHSLLRQNPAFVDGDFLWQAVQVDGVLQIALCCFVALGRQKEVHRIACLVPLHGTDTSTGPPL